MPEQRKVISLIHQTKTYRRGVMAGARRSADTTHDTVVKLMAGG